MSQWQCEKKLARRLFNFGVVNTTDDDCEQQMPSVALRLQQLIAPTGGETTVCLVDIICGLTPSRTGDRINY